MPEAGRRFSDWELTCPQAAVPPDRGDRDGNCRLHQTQAVADGRAVVFLFNVVRQNGRPIAIVSTPLNVYLPAGLSLSVDGGRPVRALFETCNVSGCHAGFPLD